MACIEDFRDFVIGSDPMQVEHIWQSMYVHSFYRAGPVMGSAISAIDQALWDIRGKALGMPVYRLLGGPLDPRGVRGYYHADGVRTPEALAKLRETAIQQGVSCFKTGLAELLRVDRDAQEDRRGGEIDAGAARGARSGHRHRGGLPRQDQPERGVDPGEGSGAAEPAVHRRAVSAGECAGDGEDRAPLHHADRDGRAAGRQSTGAAN